MNPPLNEAEIRVMIEELKANDPYITLENCIYRIKLNVESQGSFKWSDDLENKIRYCFNINPN